MFAEPPMIDQSRPRPYAPNVPDFCITEFSPVPRQCQRHDGWTADRQRRFIAALADLGSVRAAAHAVNMTPEGAYLLRRHPQGEEFRAAWEAALALGVQRLEDTAMDRALNGVEVPVYHFGEIIGTRRVYNDRLLMFLLRNRAPARFAADSVPNADAATRSHLERLKREWRKEWEAEQAGGQAESSDAVILSINAKLEKMRERESAAMTPRTRALWEAWQKAEAEDRAAGRTGYGEEAEESAGEADREDEARGGDPPTSTDAADPPQPGSSHPEPAEGPRALPRLLTHGDDRLGVPRKGGVW
jgi:hypothetical protein